MRSRPGPHYHYDLVELAHAKGASVEAELGHVGVGDEVANEGQHQAHLTRVEEAERFVKETLEGSIKKVELHEVFETAKAAAIQVIRQKNQLLGSVGRSTLYS